VPGADNGESSIYALCDDGTLWALSHSGQWHEMPAIPQDESKDPMAVMQLKMLSVESLAYELIHGIKRVEAPLIGELLMTLIGDQK
jgi:hypothetical protein